MRHSTWLNTQIRYLFSLITISLLSLTCLTANAGVITFNNFSQSKTNITQTPGFGFSHGGIRTWTNSVYANTFTPSVSGHVSDIWMPIRYASSNPPATSTFDVAIWDNANDEPGSKIFSVSISTYLSTTMSPFHIQANQGGYLSAGERYWLSIMPTGETGDIAWGNINEMEITPDLKGRDVFTYDGLAENIHWNVGYVGSAYSAMRIDVSTSSSSDMATDVPEPPIMLLIGSVFAMLCFKRRRKSVS